MTDTLTSEKKCYTTSCTLPGVKIYPGYGDRWYCKGCADQFDAERKYWSYITI